MILSRTARSAAASGGLRSLTRSSTRTQCRPSDQGRFLGLSHASTEMTKRHAEIVGAGFAGLTAACALAQRGWGVRVHERGDRLRTTGAGIYIYENGLRVLEAVGALDEAIRGASIARTREVRDDRNRLLSVHHWGQSGRVYSILRQRLINALAAA